MASLGNFDLFQYDELEGWKRYYGILLHVVVLFYNMLILVNLLIAIMSDEYASLSEVKTGLYWASVISEIPKYAFNKYYGVLTMLPFPLAWLNVFLIPVLTLVNDKQTLQQINMVIFYICYTPVFLVVLAIFIAVNIVLIPFAYLKTVAHKIALLRRFKGGG